MQIERRRHERLQCYLIARKPKSEEKEEDFFGIVHNISSGGAMIESECALVQGEPVTLAFVTEENDAVWEGHGRVVWSQIQEDKAFLGIAFDEPLEENRNNRLDNDFWRK